MFSSFRFTKAHARGFALVLLLALTACGQESTGIGGIVSDQSVFSGGCGALREAAKARFLDQLAPVTGDAYSRQQGILQEFGMALQAADTAAARTAKEALRKYRRSPLPRDLRSDDDRGMFIETEVIPYRKEIAEAFAELAREKGIMVSGVSCPEGFHLTDGAGYAVLGDCERDGAKSPVLHAEYFKTNTGSRFDCRLNAEGSDLCDSRTGIDHLQSLVCTLVNGRVRLSGGDEGAVENYQVCTVLDHSTGLVVKLAPSITSLKLNGKSAAQAIEGQLPRQCGR